MTTRTLERLKSRESRPEDWTGLVNFYGPQIHRVVVVNYDLQTADAQDVTADVLMQIWRSIANFSGRSDSFLAWVMVIARSKAIDFHRRKKRVEDAVGGSQWAEHVESETAAPVRRVEDFSCALEAAVANPLLYTGDRGIALRFYYQLCDLGTVSPVDREQAEGTFWKQLSEHATAKFPNFATLQNASVSDDTVRSFLLSDVLALPAKEAGEWLHKSENTIHKAASRIRKQLQENGLENS